MEWMRRRTWNGNSKSDARRDRMYARGLTIMEDGNRVIYRSVAELPAGTE